jgi:glycosyltransferase involved in cell wall biosynthesis
MTSKKKILFLSPYPKGIGPSQRFRFEQYINFFEQEFDCKQITFWNKKSWDILFSDKGHLIKTYYLLISFFKRWVTVFSINRYHIIFIHREVAHIGPPVFEWIIKYIFRKKIIYDFDDAIWFRNYSEKNKIARFFKSPWKVKYICKWADVIIVGNDYLKSFAIKYNKRVVVIPTTIDTEYHKPLPDKDYNTKKTVIGWTGTLTTLRQLDLILPVLQKLEEKYDFEFLVISNEKPEINIKPFNFIKWNKDTEIADLQKINIGIMPLYDNEWEKGKCGFKGLQYMALEIPAVMSPVGVNTKIITDGKNGFLAKTEQDWFDKLSVLIENKQLRKELGKVGRKTVIEKYSVNANKQKYFEVLHLIC